VWPPLDLTRLGLPGWRLEFVQRRVRATLRPFDPHGVFVVCFVCFVRVGRMAAVPLFNVSAPICTEFLHPYPMQTTAQVGAESLASGASQRDTQARTKSAQKAPQTRRKAHKSAQKAPPKRTRAHQKCHKSAQEEGGERVGKGHQVPERRLTGAKRSRKGTRARLKAGFCLPAEGGTCIYIYIYYVENYA